ncbi:MAG: hypothetical protein GX643_00585 [Acidimicrobiales bacterium]|nr:hypothetical protein [Acidimicrobiales bacterium]
MRIRPSARLLTIIAALVLALVAAGCTSSSDEPSATTSTVAPFDPDAPDDAEPPAIDEGIRIEVLSSQPDRATGPDARVRVTPEAGRSVSDLAVLLDGRDVTASLVEVDGALEGVVVGLIEGNNTIRAHDRTGFGAEALQRIRSWPLKGPMISGPHRPLLACSTAEHGLGEPTDADCSAPTRVRWTYVDTAGQEHDLPDPTARPADIAEITVDAADAERTVPFIIRWETGVLNRSVYDIASIDPSPEGSDADQSDAGWNGALVYRFGAGCGATHGQGTAQPAGDRLTLLRQGYALATASFNTGAVQCNDVISAETTMMVKERFVELFGVPDHTIGLAAGTGSIQTHLIAQNYPGLLDGLAGAETFPDFLTIQSGITDCQLLERWFTSAGGATLTPEQRAAVAGFASVETCRNWSEQFAGLLDPTAGCDPAASPERIYDPDTNPGGVRCTYQDAAITVFGPDPFTGAARRPLDNIGVQYGLDALNEGSISFDQFLTLNREIGGFDADGAFDPLRHEADPEAIALAYETGRVSAAAGDQRKIPIVTVDVWTDPSGDVHDHVRPFSLRDRLTGGRSPAAAPGLQVWTREPAAADPASVASTTATALEDAVGVVHRWLTAIADDSAPGSREDLLERTRPAEAADNCLIPGESEPVTGLHVYDEESPCTDRYQPSEDPRMAAGAPRVNDVLKCWLKEVDPNDYEVDLTQDQYLQLLETFPTGVCDWTQLGVGQVTPSMSDRSFEDVITPEQMA